MWILLELELVFTPDELLIKLKHIFAFCKLVLIADRFTLLHCHFDLCLVFVVVFFVKLSD